jgi:prephenate dehydrogenase
MSGRNLSTAALLGYGRFGRALASLIADAGIKVSAYDPHSDVPKNLRANNLSELTKSAEIIIAAVPASDMEKTLKELKPFLSARQLVIDVASVKHGPVAALSDILGKDIPWAATHPLFGPMSIARGERPLRAVICPNKFHPEAAARARAFYESVGCRVIEEDADEHDRVMAQTHALAFFVAKGMLETGAAQDVPFAPPSFQAMSNTIEAVRSDAGHLFYPIARSNPYAAVARKKLLAALSKIHSEIENAPETPAAAHAILSIERPAGKAPELRETRDLIDELDQKLFSLLVQRAQLAYHAARVKSEEGKPIQDPERERDLLSKRQAWAEEFDLSPEGVRGVFESILSFSRKEQEKWLDLRRSS